MEGTVVAPQIVLSSNLIIFFFRILGVLVLNKIFVYYMYVQYILDWIAQITITRINID